MPITRSVTQSSVDLYPDGSDEDYIPSVDVHGNEDEIRKSQILDTVKIIVSMRLTSNDLC